MARSFASAVIIGLGGTGQQALIRMKKMFLEECGLVPPCIKLLAFDTTPDRETAVGPAGDTITFDNSEFCHMTVRSVASAIDNPYVGAWWTPYDPLNRSTVSDGAGGIRQVGRLATFANIDTVVALLTRAFEQIHEQDVKDKMRAAGLELIDSTKPQVFVVSSLAGGTGSGAFVDFSLLCRSLGGQNMFYTAYFVMPWVFRDVAKTCFENGYAALLELERINGASPQDPYVVNYAHNRELKLEERPYHIVNLIDGRCRNGGWILSRKEVPAFVGESIFNSVGGVAKQYRQIADNVMTMIHLALGEPERWEGQRAFYSTIGISSIVYPAAKIHERLKAEFACGLIDRLIAFLEGPQAPDAAPGKGAEGVAAEFATFIAKERLTIEDGGVLNRIHQLPETTYAFDDRTLGLDLKDPNTQRNVMAILKDWREGVNREWDESKRDDQVKSEVGAAVDELLQRIQGYEQKKRAGFPAGSCDELNRLLLRHWERVVRDCTAEQEQLRKETGELERRAEATKEEITRRIPSGWWASTNPVRNACQRSTEAVTGLLRHNLRMDRLNRATRLADLWKQQAVTRVEDVKSERDSLKVVVAELRSLRLQLESRVERLSAGNMLKQKAMLEIYVGIEEVADSREAGETDQIRVQAGYKNCTTVTAEMFEEFRKRLKLEQPGSFSRLADNERESAILDFAGEKIRPATSLSVVQLLKQLNESDPGSIARLIEQAVRTSSQMLPIDENSLTGRWDIITEFTAVGGVFDDPATSQLILSGLPGSSVPRVQNVSAETGDPHRLTFANYLSVIPLYILNGIGDARARYLMRVRPPSHTDRMFEFPLVDMLPRDSVQIETLKLLSLATLAATGVVQRVPLENPIGTSSHFYRLNRDFFRVVDDSELVLPGTPGKFYSLYEQLCGETRSELRKRIRQVLLGLSEQPSVSDAVFKEIGDAYHRFRETLAAKEFNKAVTGMLYRQQMVYFRDLLEMGSDGFSIAKALELRLSFDKKQR